MTPIWWIDVFSAIGLLLVGLSALFNKDFWWKHQEVANKRQGILTSTRTPEWERFAKRFGIMFVFLGAFSLVDFLLVWF